MPPNRIDSIFDSLRQTGSKALMPFLTAGDPDLSTTQSLLTAIERSGASVCELGFPFSDPIADGPVIQASMAHALTQGTRPSQILEMVARIRPSLNMGLVAMVSFSIIHRLGLDAFLKDAASAGIDGLIIPDLPLEAARSLYLLDKAARRGLICSLLIAPTTPLDRAAKIARASTGFVYLLSRPGITGERSELPDDLPSRITNLRKVTKLPIAVGFGISTPDQVRQVVQVADAAIVGSAIMRRVAQHRHEGPDSVVRHIERFVSQLAQGLSPTPPQHPPDSRTSRSPHTKNPSI